MLNIVAAVLTLGIMGLAFGLLLAFASKIFYTETDARLPEILDALPGANCGGCGYPGCGGLANAIIDGKAPVNGCPVGGSDSAEKIAAIMGVSAGNAVREVAFVYCNGGDANAVKKFNYEGIDDCLGAMKVGGGPTACKYACLGLGTCVNVCPFGALEIIDGKAVVNEDKCTACGKCISMCPRHIIGLKPYKAKVTVDCSSLDKGVTTRNNCKVGCIGCKICEKKCAYGAISVVDNNAKIDYDKCTGCGECVAACPRKIITLAE